MKAPRRRSGAVAIVLIATAPVLMAQGPRPPGIFIPPGSGGPGPGNGPGGGPINVSNFDAFYPLEEIGGGPLIFDFGDAPDDAPLCGGGAGAFPTLPQSLNAAPGRDAPWHKPLPLFAAVNLGRAISYELSATQSLCDWQSQSCDRFGDDGPLVLCLDPQCLSGLTLGEASCGIGGFGSSFGPRPAPNAQGFWLLHTYRAENSAVETWVNVVTDADQSGSFGDDPAAWCLRDAEVSLILDNVQLHRTDPFPMSGVLHTLPNNRWGVNAFWTRFMVADERVTNAMASNWDGSGRVGGYGGGETEDWLVQSVENQYACRLPTSGFESEASLSISLDMGTLTCGAGVQVDVSSAGQSIGLLREFRTGPYRSTRPLGVHVSQLELAGASPMLGGAVNVRLLSDAPTFGVIEQIEAPAGVFDKGRMLLDARLEIELPGLGLTLTTGSRFVRLDAGAITAIPPINVPFHTPTSHGRTRLYDASTGQQVGWLCVNNFVMTDSVPAFCPGDADGDGKVDFADISAVITNWSSGGPVGDSSGDCAVDFIDISAALVHWGTSCR